jgi:hypothetical protein
MGPTTRRIFLLQAACAGTAMAATNVPPPVAGATNKIDEKDPQAVALGYVAETGKADQKKYPKHAADQKCSGCALYQGKAGDAAGGCPLFGAKQVAAGGWCGSWVKKA